MNLTGFIPVITTLAGSIAGIFAAILTFRRSRSELDNLTGSISNSLNEKSDRPPLDREQLRLERERLIKRAEERAFAEREAYLTETSSFIREVMVANRTLGEEVQKLQGELDDRRYRLLREYAAEGLAKSKISFYSSLAAAVLGFVVIITGATLSVTHALIQQGIITVVSGAIIDSVSFLFFAQDRQAQKSMFEFFERLRADRQLDESIRLASLIEEDTVRAGAYACLSMHFAGIANPEVLFKLLTERQFHNLRPAASENATTNKLVNEAEK